MGARNVVILAGPSEQTDRDAYGPFEFRGKIGRVVSRVFGQLVDRIFVNASQLVGQLRKKARPVADEPKCVVPRKRTVSQIHGVYAGLAVSVTDFGHESLVIGRPELRSGCRLQ